MFLAGLSARVEALNKDNAKTPHAPIVFNKFVFKVSSYFDLGNNEKCPPISIGRHPFQRLIIY